MNLKVFYEYFQTIPPSYVKASEPTNLHTLGGGVVVHSANTAAKHYPRYLQKKNERKMNAVEMRSPRRICGVSLAARIYKS